MLKEVWQSKQQLWQKEQESCVYGKDGGLQGVILSLLGRRPLDNSKGYYYFLLFLSQTCGRNKHTFFGWLILVISREPESANKALAECDIFSRSFIFNSLWRDITGCTNLIQIAFFFSFPDLPCHIGCKNVPKENVMLGCRTRFFFRHKVSKPQKWKNLCLYH